MTLSDTLTFKQCHLPALKIKVHNSNLRVTLTLETELDAGTARVIGCHDSAFDGQDNPRGGFETMELPYKIDACRIKLLSSRENGLNLLITPQAVEKFKVFRASDAVLGVRFAVTTDRARDAIDFMLETAGTEFAAVVEPGQAELDFTGDPSRTEKPVSDEKFMEELGIGETPEAEPAETPEPPEAKRKPKAKGPDA